MNDLIVVEEAVYLVERIAKESSVEAEKALEKVASSNGDEFAMELVEKIGSSTLLNILLEGDYSCPSIISFYISPEQVVEIIKTYPLRWDKLTQKADYNAFVEIKNDMFNLFSSFLLVDEKSCERKRAIIEAIEKDEYCMSCLAFIFSEWKNEREKSFFLDDSEMELGSPDHLYEVIKALVPRVAEKIIDFSFSKRGKDLKSMVIDLKAEAEDRIVGEIPEDSVEDSGFVLYIEDDD